MANVPTYDPARYDEFSKDAWRNRAVFDIIDGESRLVRPANDPPFDSYFTDYDSFFAGLPGEIFGLADWNVSESASASLQFVENVSALVSAYAFFKEFFKREQGFASYTNFFWGLICHFPFWQHPTVRFYQFITHI